MPVDPSVIIVVRNRLLGNDAFGKCFSTFLPSSVSSGGVRMTTVRCQDGTDGTSARWTGLGQGRERDEHLRRCVRCLLLSLSVPRIASSKIRRICPLEKKND